MSKRHESRVLSRAPAQCRPGAGERGHTLMEVMVATGILAIVLTVSMTVMKTTADLAETGRAYLDVNGKLESMTSRFGEFLRYGKVTSIAADGTSISFMVPVDPVNVPKTYMDADGKIMFGAVEAGGEVVGNTMTIRFEQVRTPNRKLKVIDEAALNININRTTEFAAKSEDKTDRFAVGRLVLTTTGGRRQLLPGDLFIQPDGDFGGDIDGDGDGDPIFSLSLFSEDLTDTDGSGVWDEGEDYVDSNENRRWDMAVRVNLWGLRLDGSKRPHLHRLAADILVPNQTND